MSLLRSAGPPARAVELQRWLLSSGDELRSMRSGLHLLVGTGDLGERIVLVATELASNAIRHGRLPADVRLLRGDGEFILDVADSDLTGVPLLANAHHADSGGRGLQIARTLAGELCWYATDTDKHVWASFPI
ncbi:ATP-binding protein [Actinoplanes friuliensis]|uniref:Histidine kinase/HSP90-like ATPase domain-containing protein n=1 Tax=Actinoplanes friuliensis DSM 7358 TaxID=1246995 RepID=U5W1H9_9ACTN|nr:ATP-binding protein [Actinoplanes friuliensis]AGZ41771.1 hypothetical protein AFR_17465 [Actinoplanes friuliensis DSM 7358]